MKQKSMEIGMYAISALVGSMIYGLFGFVGVFIFGIIGLLVISYLINRLSNEFRKDAQTRLEQLKSEFSQPRE